MTNNQPPKYSIGQEVYVIYSRKAYANYERHTIEKVIVYGVNHHYSQPIGELICTYTYNLQNLDDTQMYDREENQIYATKEEIIANLP